jgi:helicase
MRRLNPFVQVIALSATMGNRSELANWLEGIHYQSDWRPVPLTWGIRRFTKAADKPDICLAAVQDCLNKGGQSLVFVVSRRRAEQLAKMLVDEGIRAGHHHAGLEKAERQAMEHGFRHGEIQVLVSTGTLEMGLNLPARQVVLYDLQRFDGWDFTPLSTNTVWQRAGRAGRRGLDPEGEVVLLVPAWDRQAERYLQGQFESIQSGLKEARALTEQVLTEVGSGLCRTRDQLARCLAGSLAAHQKRLPPLGPLVQTMLQSGMLVEPAVENGGRPLLKATRLGRIAVRQMLAPDTVLRLANHLNGETAQNLTYLDLLLLAALTEDCEPKIPADFEELDELCLNLSQEPSTLLRGTQAEVIQRLGIQGKPLLTALKTALVARASTRLGDAELVGNAFDCYPFEVRRLAESLERILSAAVAILSTPTEDEPEDEVLLLGAPDLAARVKALQSMVSHGLDEEVITLTYVQGVGGTLARRLKEAGISDIEELADAESRQLAKIRGISLKRARLWIREAGRILKHRSAFSLKERDQAAAPVVVGWPKEVDPYRLRRSLDLNVVRHGGGWQVTGGLEPHTVHMPAKGVPTCDCQDFEKGHQCKHLMAVRRQRKDPALLKLIRGLDEHFTDEGLDLFQLWFDRGRS